MENKPQTATVLILDGQGGAKPSDLSQAFNSKSLAWIHLDYSSEVNKAWLIKKSGLDEFLYEALLERDTRPRIFLTQHGILLIMRSINRQPMANPEDMISVRIWMEENRIITVAKRELLAIAEIRDLLSREQGPKNIGEFLDELTERITNHISEQVDLIDEQIDVLEEEVLKKFDSSLRHKLAEQRTQIIALKRYVAPQRDALSRLTQIDRFAWLNETDRLHLLETSDRTIRCIEDLDEARDRATIVQETLSNRLSEQLGSRMYILSTVAAIFLPLSFVTGLLGINVGGIPGSATKWAFTVVCVSLVIVGIVEFWFFKKKRWL